jgi:hypothetical protein
MNVWVVRLSGVTSDAATAACAQGGGGSPLVRLTRSNVPMALLLGHQSIPDLDLGHNGLSNATALSSMANSKYRSSSCPTESSSSTFSVMHCID